MIDNRDTIQEENLFSVCLLQKAPNAAEGTIYSTVPGTEHVRRIQNKEMREKVDSMSRLFLTVFINIVLED